MNNELKDYYIKKIEQHGPFAVYQVDGRQIRNKLDVDFTNFGQHYCFPFIPLYEFWLDEEADPNEKNFFINHLLIEWKLMKRGYSKSQAIDEADKKELAERKKTNDLKKVMDKNGQICLKSIYDKKLKKINNEISVWLVYGRLVRSDFYIDFTEGGHDVVYDFIPKNEVWIDNDIFPEERPYVILHELYERKLMKKGMKYIEAHKNASKIEWGARHDKDVLKKNLDKLGWL